jgi:hypothetical protein
MECPSHARWSEAAGLLDDRSRGGNPQWAGDERRNTVENGSSFRGAKDDDEKKLGWQTRLK